ncbi:MAG: histidinol-phosphate transaminase, partial [bacterium]
SNENPEGPLPDVVAAIQKAALGVNRYPDSACFHLTRRLSVQLGVQPANLIFGNGSNEVIDMLIRALVSPGENIVFSEHSFIVYPLTAGVHFECGRSIPLDENDKHDLRAMAAAVDDKTKLVIVCNPNNPTGTYNNVDEFTALLDTIPERVIVAVDEAYYEYVVAEDYPQTQELAAKYPNLVILRTFSKIHSLAGLRVGYGIGHPDLIAELQKTREPFNVNAISQAAALACIDHWSVLPERARRNREWLEKLAADLHELGLDVTPSQTNFLLVRCPGKASKMTQALLQRGIIVRPMAAFGLGEGALRISVGLPAENERCIAALKEILNEDSWQGT